MGTENATKMLPGLKKTTQKMQQWENKMGLLQAFNNFILDHVVSYSL